MVRRLSSCAAHQRRGLTVAVAQVFIEYKSICEELPEANHATVGCVIEETVSKEDVHFSHGKQKSKNLTLPSTHCPSYFEADRLVALCVMIIGHMVVGVVVVNHFRIVKDELLSHVVLLPNVFCHPSSGIQSTVH